jgi:hypothetical protein
MKLFMSASFSNVFSGKCFTHFTRFDMSAPGPVFCTSENVMVSLHSKKNIEKTSKNKEKKGNLD